MFEMGSNKKYSFYIHMLSSYREFTKYLKSYFISIPNTNTNWIPQGVCQTYNSTLITAYDDKKKDNSVVYFIDANSNVKTLRTDNKCHVGGISYDSKTKIVFMSADKNVNIYSLDYLDSCKNNEQLTKYKKIYLDGKVRWASYLTVNNGSLYVGNFVNSNDRNENKSYLDQYLITSSGKLGLLASYEVPFYDVQGMCIYNYQGIDYYIFTSSYGRKRDSILYITCLEDGKFKKEKSITLPCMAEQISTTPSGDLAIIFESNASKYNGLIYSSTTKISDVCYFDIKKYIVDNIDIQ